MAEFRIECFENEFLPKGASVINAVLSVTVAGTGGEPSGDPEGRAGISERSEVIVVDTSGSMQGEKLRQAKVATAAAIDCLPDGVAFGIVSGSELAELVYPSSPPLAVSSSTTRDEAKEAVKQLEAEGGTAMGAWINLATRLLREQTGIKHAILLTDGRNEHEEPEVLDKFLVQADGVFQCDCRGVGADWEVADLRKIATALLGAYDIVAEPSELSADFASMMHEALSKQIADMTLRVWTPQGAAVSLLKQMEPILLDLTGARVDTGPLTGEYATGSWGDESRDYHLGVLLTPRNIGDEVLAARVTLLVGGEAVGQAQVRAVWTDDEARSTRINRRVAEVMGETELADVIQEGIDAHRAGDLETATNRFGRAVQLASESGNEEAVARLSKVVDIEDAATGRVRPKDKVEELDVMIVETRSTRTTRTGR